MLKSKRLTPLSDFPDLQDVSDVSASISPDVLAILMVCSHLQEWGSMSVLGHGQVNNNVQTGKKKSFLALEKSFHFCLCYSPATDNNLFYKCLFKMS